MLKLYPKTALRLVACGALGGLASCTTNLGGMTVGGVSDAGTRDVQIIIEAGPPCNGPSDCKGTTTCCGGMCTDVSKDPRNCGSCGNACSTGQFCTGTTCTGAVLANICQNTHATVVTDQYASDNTAGPAIGAALTANCSPPTVVQQVSQDTGNALENGTDRPVTGVGNTYVVGGGGYGQKGWAYLDSASLTALFVNGDTDNEWIEERTTAAKLVSAPRTMLGPSHDYFFIETVVEPYSGTLCLGGVGILGYGTSAAGYFIPTQVLPHLSMYTASWYIFEWTDSNNDGQPNAGDTWKPITQGN
jgi:hypothetical protein